MRYEPPQYDSPDQPGDRGEQPRYQDPADARRGEDRTGGQEPWQGSPQEPWDDRADNDQPRYGQSRDEAPQYGRRTEEQQAYARYNQDRQGHDSSAGGGYDRNDDRARQDAQYGGAAASGQYGEAPANSDRTARDGAAQYGYAPANAGYHGQGYRDGGGDGGGQYSQYEMSSPYAPKPTPGRGLAIASLVLGILAIVLCFLAFPLLGAIIGLILGIVALVKARKVPGAKKGMAIAGIILNVIGMALNAVMLLLWILVGGMALNMVNDPSAQACMDQYMNEEIGMDAYQQCLQDALQQPSDSPTV